MVIPVPAAAFFCETLPTTLTLSSLQAFSDRGDPSRICRSQLPITPSLFAQPASIACRRPLYVASRRHLDYSRRSTCHLSRSLRVLPYYRSSIIGYLSFALSSPPPSP
ncbi:hypothetical protein M413DRAFT_345987 [Hebeloma cylindrosporum]|uniref:Uncharacterized protein n=1 Tax=Hebeloma cylindrosporum TaxID=76867 RepID=A0A0C2YXN1_HEBCY|nr:hypothetical protein M413DRAFT_345987 [Hebeloma cylindrosporum h7]